MGEVISSLSVVLGSDITNYKKGMTFAQKQNAEMIKSFKDLTSTLQSAGGAIAGYFALDSLTDFASKTIAVTSEFEKLQAVLKTTLGSQSSAQIAFAKISDFASKTPFQVNELTESFVKLSNRGFIPTTNQLRQLGDLAASQGKSFNQLTEALLDAQTMQFERLKEFGIKASKQGDQVSFSFKGVTTTVKATDSAIKDYILSLGDLQGVSGGMAEVSNTLGGSISNLGDKTDAFFFALGTANNGVLKGSINLFGEWLDLMTKSIKSVQEIKEGVKNGTIGQAIEEDNKELAINAEKLGSVQKAAELMIKSYQKIIETRNASITDEYIKHEKLGAQATEETAAALEERVRIEKTQIGILNEQILSLKKVYLASKEKSGQDLAEVGIIKQLSDEQKKLKDFLENSASSESEIAKTNDRIAAIDDEIASLKKLSAERVKSINPVASRYGAVNTNSGLGDNNVQGTPKSFIPEIEEGKGSMDLSAMELQVVSFAEQFKSAFQSAGEDFKSFGETFKNVAKNIIKTIIATGIANLIAKTFAITGPLGLAVAGGVGSAGAALFSAAIPKFADGGIAYGPTIGMMGEYAGAASNPEVIAPLSNLKSMIGSGGATNITVTGRISGSDIILSGDNYSRNKERRG